MLAVWSGDRVVLLERVRFTEQDKVASRDVLEAVAALLQAAPGVMIRAEVHTDGSLGAQSLQRSGDRAEDLRRVLIDLGVNPGRIDAVGYGHLKPLDRGRWGAAGGDERVEISAAP